MKLHKLLDYSKQTGKNHISGSESAEIGYLKFHFKRFEELFAKLKKHNKGKLLDIGTTPFTLYLAEQGKHEIFTYDYNDLQKDRCSVCNVNFNFGNIEVDDLPYPDNYFNIVLFAEVFEHLHTDPVKLLRKLHRILIPGATLILGTPNLASFANRLKLALNRPILEYPTWDDEVYGHDRLYVKKELVEYLQQAGFKIESSRYSDSLDFYSHSGRFTTETIMKTLLKVLSFPFRKIWPSLNGTIIICAQKRPIE